MAVPGLQPRVNRPVREEPVAGNRHLRKGPKMSKQKSLTVWDTDISPRRRTRTAPVERALARPDETYTADGWTVRTYAGGGVGASYGYTATCEVAVAITNPAGDTVVFRATDYATDRVGQAHLGRLLPGMQALVRYDCRWAAPEGDAVDAAWQVAREYHRYAQDPAARDASPADYRRALAQALVAA